jgi:hypothetical protein
VNSFRSRYSKTMRSSIRGFQDQVYEDFKIKYTMTPIFSFQSNAKSVLDHIAPKFSIYSIELDLYDRKGLFYAPMLGFTRLDLSCPKALEVFG